MNNYSVSVVMSIYNEPLHFVINSVNSLLNQTFQNLELIIIMDNPERTDIIKYINDLSKRNSSIKFFVNEENRGLVYSLNKALKFATGEFIARMDADDYSVESRIERELNYLITNNLDLVGCNMINMDYDNNLSKSVVRYPESHKSHLKQLKNRSTIPHPTWLGRKKVFDRLNGYRDIEACEDYDFIIRLVSFNFKVGVLQEPLLYYRINPYGISHSKRAFQKISFYYLCNNYKKKIIPTVEEYNGYMKSTNGKDNIRKYDEYLSIYKKYKSETRFINKILNGIKIFVLSKYGRKALLNYCKEYYFKMS